MVGISSYSFLCRCWKWFRAAEKYFINEARKIPRNRLVSGDFGPIGVLVASGRPLDYCSSPFIAVVPEGCWLRHLGHARQIRLIRCSCPRGVLVASLRRLDQLYDVSMQLSPRGVGCVVLMPPISVATSYAVVPEGCWLRLGRAGAVVGDDHAVVPEGCWLRPWWPRSDGHSN